MRLRLLAAIVAAALLSGGLAGVPAFGDTEPSGALEAGFARADVTWHAPGAQGQYSSEGNAVVDDRWDPYVHNAKTKPADGIQSRSYARAMVVRGTSGELAAYVGHDLYLQQDVLTRRIAQLLAERDVPITRENLMIGASHNHSATSLSSTAWGVWAFTDVLDPRFFDFVSRRIADSVADAFEALRPVRMGAAVTEFDDVQRNILGPAVADDGTPAGFPYDYFDDELAVVRFDDVSDPSAPKPYGMFVNLGMHPESISTADMSSADFVGMVDVMVRRSTGAQLTWSQGAVGDVEPDRDGLAHPAAEKKEYWHRDFAQAERMSRIVADAVSDTWAAAGGPGSVVPFTTSVPVNMSDVTFPGPASHPAPTVSNCRTEQAARGEPGVPVAGFPDCERLDGPDAGPVYDALHDVPLPQNYGVTGYGGAQESLNVHLQVLQLGEVLLATCPCEPITDMVLNLKSRLDEDSGNLHDGFDWPCRPASGGGVECNFARSAFRPDDWRPVDPAAYAKMRAQIHNDAAGWDSEEAEAIVAAEAEPADPSKIKGNFTKQEIQDLGGEGFALPLMVGQANDYIGYIVTYREHQRGDHYRKALTAFGPHTADYVNTRLVKMAAGIQSGELFDAKVPADAAANEAKALSVAAAAEAERAALDAALPDDGGDPFVIGLDDGTHPRFDGVQVRWVGGSAYTDNPVVTVEREVRDPDCEVSEGRACGTFQPFASQDGGEVVVNLLYYEASDPEVPALWATGDLANAWQASFEVFETTPVGRFRFVIEGHHRNGGAAVPYRLEVPFGVDPWGGITPRDPAFDAASASASFTVAPIVYPHTWEASLLPYVSENTSNTPTGSYCFRCTLRPWASAGSVVSATVTVIHRFGGETDYPATFDGQKWVVSGLSLDFDPSTGLVRDTIVVDRGGVTDQYGNINGSRLEIYVPPLDDGR